MNGVVAFLSKSQIYLRIKINEKGVNQNLSTKLCKQKVLYFFNINKEVWLIIVKVDAARDAKKMQPL